MLHAYTSGGDAQNTTEYNVDITKRRELLRGRSCATASTTKNFAALFLTGGMTMCIDRLCAFFSNVTLLSALTGGFSCAVLVQPPSKMLESDSLLKDASGLCGILGFVLLLAAAVDSVLIDNTLKMLSTPAAFLSFLDSHPSFLGLPIKLLMLGCVCVVVQLLIVISFIFDGLLVWIGSAIVAIGVGALFRRHTNLVSFMEGTTSHMAQCR